MIKLSKRGEAKAEILEGTSEYGYKVGKIILYLGNFLSKRPENGKQDRVLTSCKKTLIREEDSFKGK